MKRFANQKNNNPDTQHNVMILADSHGHGISSRINYCLHKKEKANKVKVSELIKPGAKLSQAVNTSSGIKYLTANNHVILGSNEAKQMFPELEEKLQTLSHTSVIVTTFHTGMILLNGLV